MSSYARRSLVSGAVLLAVILLSGCDFTDDQAMRRRKFYDVGEIDVYGREQQYSYGGKQVQNARQQRDLQYASRKHAHEVGEISIDDRAVEPRPVPRAQLEQIHPVVSVQPRNAPAPRAAPEYRTGRT
jgi:hypothetical protein